MKQVKQIMYISKSRKLITKDYSNPYWFCYHIMCGDHYEDRYYVVDDFGTMICVEYNYKNYSSTVRLKNDREYRNRL